MTGLRDDRLDEELDLLWEDGIMLNEGGRDPDIGDLWEGRVALPNELTLDGFRRGRGRIFLVFVLGHFRVGIIWMGGWVVEGGFKTAEWACINGTGWTIKAG